MATHTRHSCDICKHDAKYIGKRIQVVFTTETNEGRGCKPYLDDVSIDLCETCLEKVIAYHPLRAAGAQGYNDYTLTPAHPQQEAITEGEAYGR